MGKHLPIFAFMSRCRGIDYLCFLKIVTAATTTTTITATTIIAFISVLLSEINGT